MQFAGFDTRVIDLNNPVIFDNGELKITAFRVVHEPIEPALGFKFEYKGRSIVITGDTSYTQSVIDNSMNAFVTGNNYIYIHTGLLENLDSYEELEGIIAHEIGHLKLGHVESRIILSKKNWKNVAPCSLCTVL